MPSLSRELRRELERTVKEARSAAEVGAIKALEQLAVHHHEPWSNLSADQKTLRNRLRAHGRQLGDVRDERRETQGIAHLAAECAYEHWHRMLFARFLAEANLLIEPESGQPISIDECQQLARERNQDWLILGSEFAQKMLPQIFRPGDPVLEIALPTEARSKLEDLLKSLHHDVFLASDSLGWVYQFWQSERKDEINHTAKKIGADELAAVTQLFTEDYMVDFLLHNTIGAWFVSKAGPINAATESEARAKAALPIKDGLGITWTYLRLIQDERTKKWLPAAGEFTAWPKQTKQIRFLDPCMGSGHFLVFALPMLARIRMEEEGLSTPEAIHATLLDNIFGLELDERCTQIAAFNLALTAWKLGGYRALPQFHLACSGLAPHAGENDWVALAGENDRLRRGMARLHALFKDAPVLGSLISPRSTIADLLEADFHELQPLLEKALAQEKKDDTAHEMAVTARGLAKAAEVLASEFTLVATNVPYLGLRKQDDILRNYCERVHNEAKADLATCFVERCLEFCSSGVGTTALVTPHNWLFLGSYKNLRKRLLCENSWESVSRLGSHAFETIGGEIVNVALVSLTRCRPDPTHSFLGLDVSAKSEPIQKAGALVAMGSIKVSQSRQLNNPDARITLVEAVLESYLSTYADGLAGILNGDSPHYLKLFWEIPERNDLWSFQQTTQERTADFGGLHNLVYFDERGGHLREVEQIRKERLHNSDQRGQNALNKQGIAVSSMGRLPVSRFLGSRFDSNVAAVIPKDQRHLAAIWCFCSSPEYYESVREMDQALKVTNASLVKVHFDLEYWQKVAAQKYPQGLPKPFSEDPTQWLFSGHPKGSGQPLQVAVARLLGYRWPRQTGCIFLDCPTLDTDVLEQFRDVDGIVCLRSINGKQSASEALRKLLAASYGREWSASKEAELLAGVGASRMSLEEWLQNGFFGEHCALFHQRPFVWHIWDGRLDGFQALINYHRLTAAKGSGRRVLEKLIFTYLGGWIEQQRAEQKRGTEGADARLAASEYLKNELEKILVGEPPYDLFVRWKPLHEQPIGWEPDINDGVRLNIRPFLNAKPLGARGQNVCILRTPPKIKFDKDRGKDSQRLREQFPWLWNWNGEGDDFEGDKSFDGNRWNDLHYSVRFKNAARERYVESQQLVKK